MSTRDPRPGSDAQFAALGIELPEVPRPIANFVPWRRHGGFVFLAGQVCEWNGPVVHQGKVGRELGLEVAQQAARICALNLLAALREALRGDLGEVKAVIRLGGFVNCVDDYPQVPQVINGASDLFHEVFGTTVGAHARTAVGVAMLPRNAAVEVDAIVAVE